jgi:hypothetical protein
VQAVQEEAPQLGVRDVQHGGEFGLQRLDGALGPRRVGHGGRGRGGGLVGVGPGGDDRAAARTEGENAVLARRAAGRAHAEVGPVAGDPPAVVEGCEGGGRVEAGRDRARGDDPQRRKLALADEQDRGRLGQRRHAEAPRAPVVVDAARLDAHARRRREGRDEADAAGRSAPPHEHVVDAVGGGPGLQPGADQGELDRAGPRQRAIGKRRQAGRGRRVPDPRMRPAPL